MPVEGNTKAPYETPSITTMDAAEVLDALGPAQGMSSGGGQSGPGMGPSGLYGTMPSGGRRVGRR